MKTILLDTDIGVDCDDAIALAMALNGKKEGRLRLPLITLSTARKGSGGCTRAILKAYGEEIPLAKIRKPLPIDSRDNYGEKVAAAFGETDGDLGDAVEAWRTLYKTAEGKITPVVIGPQTNLAAFLKEEKELFKEKTEHVYIMAGRFDEKTPEFNVEQDVPACLSVATDLPCKCSIIPFETGCKVLTGKRFLNERNHPVGLSIEECFKSWGQFDNAKMLRESWDPLTLLAALDKELFYPLLKGRLCVDDRGVTTIEADGTDKFEVLSVKDAAAAADAVEKMLR